MHFGFIMILMVPILHLSSFAPFALTIEIKDLRNSKGQLLLEVYDGGKNVIAKVNGSIENNVSVIMIKDLMPGKYAFRYFHDENFNNKLDTNWMGIPKEGFGFSNNAMGTFGPPAFEKWLLELVADKKVNCIPKYM